MVRAIILTLALALMATAAQGRNSVDPVRVRAQLDFLAGPDLHGRGSATPDEAIAASYVASQLQSYGLKTAPGMTGYLQRIPVLRQALAGPVELLIDGVPAPDTTPLRVVGGVWGGKVAVLGRIFPDTKAAVLVVPDTAAKNADIAKARAQVGATVTIVVADKDTPRAIDAIGGRPNLPRFFPAESPAGRTSTIAVGSDTMQKLLGAGATVTLSVPFTLAHDSTTNAVAYLPGSDPAAGVLLLSAHLDHLGVGADGTIWPGANDDASGTVALMEIARAMAAGKRPRRGILFVAYGSEERGGFGSRWFGDHPPVPLNQIAANIEFEMIGASVPKLAADRLMMTGYERSDLGSELRAHGALIDADPYPEQQYFRRSDNYALALRGVVAHTVSGYGEVTTYHTPQDTPDRIDAPYMVRAIESLLKPIRWLANNRFTPRWTKDGQPKE
ncbi:M28 family peptidase [Sphingomonas sp. A2-49]|uniref:M28 family metallopeptidase n=1 Tax=Sphingomonas sp. A2-49 TaxID=1391375 RepID=UPI0021D1E294|nr:M28 family peptidase [Sphingomonas sp. A2-49]MCU6456042.1 M28 family peptidase [Sphingomonas sp. A2-49]